MYQLMEEMRIYFLDSRTRERPSVQYLNEGKEEWSFLVIKENKAMTKLFSVTISKEEYRFCIEGTEERYVGLEQLERRMKQIIEKHVREIQ